MKIIGMEPDQQSISFSRNEWKHFLDEVEMRGGKEIEKCINNARYLALLDLSYDQVKVGKVVVKTLEELEAMA